MIAHCKELGFKEPAWKVKQNTVTVTFPDLVVPFNYNEGICEGISEGLNKLIVKVIDEGISKGISEGLNGTYHAIIEVLIKKGSLKVTEKLLSCVIKPINWIT